MPREVTDEGGVRWSCVQAYVGLTPGGGNEEAARVEGAGDLFEVVCTPSGGGRTVRLKLAGGWEQKLSDEGLLREIAAGR